MNETLLQRNVYCTMHTLLPPLFSVFSIITLYYIFYREKSALAALISTLRHWVLPTKTFMINLRISDVARKTPVCVAHDVFPTQNTDNRYYTYVPQENYSGYWRGIFKLTNNRRLVWENRGPKRVKLLSVFHVWVKRRLAKQRCENMFTICTMMIQYMLIICEVTCTYTENYSSQTVLLKTVFFTRNAHLDR